MRTSKAYYVEYRMYGEEPKGIMVLAVNKEDAYDKAVYKIIPSVEEGHMPYSAWVASVTYQNGNYKRFNTFEGMPY